MKAAVYHTYGPPDVVHIEDVEKPSPKDNEVLLKVRAASINPLDRHIMRGKPYIARLAFGFPNPQVTRPGADVAGVVESAGSSAKQFKAGDAVFGMCKGAFAEYVCAPESGLAMKPDNVTFEQAASAPVAAYTALQGLRDKGHIQPRQKVLVNGAAGGVGTFAVQMAKYFGAEVTGVCGTKNLAMVRSIGADQVIDYLHENFTESGQPYDIIFDLVGNHSLSACRRALTPKGILLMAGILGEQGMLGLLARTIAALVLPRFVSQKFIMFVARSNQKDLTTIGELMAAGKLVPVIQTRHKLADVPEALRLIDSHHARGKIIINMD